MTDHTQFYVGFFKTWYQADKRYAAQAEQEVVPLAGAYRCWCPLMSVPCSNPTSAPRAICASCASGDHSAHGRNRQEGDEQREAAQARNQTTQLEDGSWR